jgi:spermidine synthase
MTSFLNESLSPGLTRHWDIQEVLHAGNTTYQDVLIARTCHGVTLFCDQERQSAELSQLVYHEALMIPGLLLTATRDRILIIGSSEGVASQIAVASGASIVDHVDIDRECVELCALHLPYGYSVDELATAVEASGPVRVRYSDGYQFVTDAAAAGRRYDLIVIDLPDEVLGGSAQHNRLYGADFLRSCKDLLTPGGVVAAQAGCPTLWRQQTLSTSLGRFQQVFPATAFYGSWEHEWAFLFGTCADGDLTARMIEQLPCLPYRAETLDTDSLASGSILPFHCRHPADAPSVSQAPPGPKITSELQVGFPRFLGGSLIWRH